MPDHSFLRMCSMRRARCAAMRAASGRTVRMPKCTRYSPATHRISISDVCTTCRRTPVASTWVATLLRAELCSRPGFGVLCVFMAVMFAAPSFSVHVQKKESRT